MLSGQLNADDLDEVEKEFDELFHVELPDVPDAELEAIKEAAGIPVKKSGGPSLSPAPASETKRTAVALHA